MTHSPLTRATPESQGIDPAAIEALYRRIEERQLPLHSLMILRHGHVVSEAWWEPYTAPQRHMVFSVSKSFNAAAIGIAEAKGLLSVDDDVLSFFPSYATDAIRANVAGLKVRDLLSMSTGHVVDTMSIMSALPGEDWVKLFFSVPIVYPPGTHFLYNSGASFVLAAIITARTGQSVLDYLTPRLLDPLGIDTPPWQLAPSGINLGASGLRLRTEDIAKLGQLYLQRGLWQGQRLLTEDWIDRASSVQVQNGGNPMVDWNQGYGYQFWRSRHNSYRADGAFGQFALILPELDLVVAITEGSDNAQATLDAVWEALLPGVQDSALTPTDGSVGRLEELATSRLLATPDFLDADPERAALVAGRPIALPFNTLGVSTATVRFEADAVLLDIVNKAGTAETIRAGRTSWLHGTSTTWWLKFELETLATGAKAGWTKPNTLEIHEQCLDTPFRRVWSFTFADDGAVTLKLGLSPAYWGVENEVLRASLG
jgi:CubicO group peptidase (beta-lactamase class C family)